MRAIDLNGVQLLVDGGANPSLAIKDGSTPLMAAAGLGAPRAGDKKSPRLADRNDPIDARKGADRERRKRQRRQRRRHDPLHYAAQRGSDRIVEFPVSQGARFDVKNKQGRAVRARTRGKTAALMSKLAGASTRSNQSLICTILDPVVVDCRLLIRFIGDSAASIPNRSQSTFNIQQRIDSHKSKIKN